VNYWGGKGGYMVSMGSLDHYLSNGIYSRSLREILQVEVDEIYILST